MLAKLAFSPLIHFGNGSRTLISDKKMHTFKTLLFEYNTFEKDFKSRLVFFIHTGIYWKCSYFAYKCEALINLQCLMFVD